MKSQQLLKKSAVLLGMIALMTVGTPQSVFATDKDGIKLALGDKDDEPINVTISLINKFGEDKDAELSDNVTTEEEDALASDFRNSIPQDRTTEVWQKNNFLEMRQALESLTETVVCETGVTGLLYNAANYSTDTPTNDSQDVSYQTSVGNEDVKAFMSDSTNQASLAGIAAVSFSDVTGKEWYASHIPMAVYYGLTNGYTDGTFKGTQAVTRAEFAALLSNFTRSFSDSVSSESLLTDYENKWYYYDIDQIGSGAMSIYAMSVEEMESGVSRGEVALVLAKNCFLSDYETEYQNVTTSEFKDIKTLTQPTTLMYEADDDHEGANVEYKIQLTTPSSCPTDVVAALNVLKRNGIMAGDENGASNWNKKITRAEAIALFERCAQEATS